MVMVAVPPEALAVLDLLAVGVFAASGALVAARREMDPFGFLVLGTVTGIGGGTLRDLVLDQPVFWVVNEAPLMVCATVSLATFWAARLLHSRYRALVWMDALGMAMYAVVGTQKAMAAGAGPLVAAIMGMMTASFGGLLRDVLCGQAPLMFHREIYATAALAGAGTVLALSAAGAAAPTGWGVAPQAVWAAGGFLVAFALRAAAIVWGWSLPRYRRPDRPLDGPPPQAD